MVQRLIYGAEIARGIDVFRLKPSEFLSQNEIDAAMQFRLNEFNSQNQPKVTWPATSAVAKAYLDQLGRNNAISPERARRFATASRRSTSCAPARNVMPPRGSTR